MTRREQKGGDDPVLYRPANGAPARRLDGKPLSDFDRAILDGKDPIGEQVKARKGEKTNTAG